MGSTLSTTIGQGIAIPHEFQRKIEDEHESDDYWDGFYEWLDEEVRKYEGLDSDGAYFYDYSPADNEGDAHVVFIKSTTTTVYGAEVARVKGNTGFLDLAGIEALAKFCEDHGLDFNDLYGSYAVVSYG